MGEIDECAMTRASVLLPIARITEQTMSKTMRRERGKKECNRREKRSSSPNVGGDVQQQLDLGSVVPEQTSITEVVVVLLLLQYCCNTIVLKSRKK